MRFAVPLLLAALVCGVSAHGWITSPVSKNEMAKNHYVSGMPDSLRYEPQTCYWYCPDSGLQLIDHAAAGATLPVKC